MASIKDVAKHANLSVSAVSKYLKNPNSVRNDTRGRIELAIKDLNYTPNLAARSLRTKRTGIILVNYCPGPEYGGNSSIINRIYDFLLSAAARNGYTLLMCPEERQLESEKDFGSHIRSDFPIDGIVYLMPRRQKYLEAFSQQFGDKPQVIIGRMLHMPNIPTAIWNMESAMYGITRHLLEQGHTKIGYIAGRPKDEAPNDRWRGHKRAMEQVGIAIKDEYFSFKGPMSPETGYNAALELLRLPNRPSAIVCENDFSAFGCIWCAQRMGLRVPEDLAVTGMDDLDYSRIFNPPLTTAEFPLAELANWAIDTMVTLLNAKKDGTLANVPALSLFDSKLIVRNSSDPSKPAPPYVS